MLSIGVVAQKGGAGKTTLAVHLAVLAHGAGKKVALIDCDPQHSAVKWYMRRRELQPVLIDKPARELAPVLEQARVEGYDIVIVDTAPHANSEATRAVRAIDFALIPCRPAVLDIDAVNLTVDLVRALKKPAALVLNGCQAGRTIAESGTTSEAREALSSHGLPVAPIAICNRVDLQHALNDGRAVTEFAPTGRAADELRRLWSWLMETTR